MGKIKERLKEMTRSKFFKIVDYKDYDEPYIYDEETSEYFSCLDAMMDYYRIKNLEMPKYVYGVYFESIELDVGYILESACEEHHEDAIYSLDGVGELKEAIDKFNKDNKTNGTYFEDINTVVRIEEI